MDRQTRGDRPSRGIAGDRRTPERCLLGFARPEDLPTARRVRLILKPTGRTRLAVSVLPLHPEAHDRWRLQLALKHGSTAQEPYGRRATRSISTNASTASAVPPTVVRAGSFPGVQTSGQMRMSVA